MKTFLMLFTLLIYTGGKQVRSAPPSPMNTSDPTTVYYTALIWYQDTDKLRKFEREATPFFEKYGIALLRIIDKVEAIPAEGEDHIATPDEVQLFSARDGEALGELFEDLDFQKLLPLRAEGVKKMTIIAGAPELTEDTDTSAQIFAAGLFYFDGTGKSGLRNFEKQAAPYFKKHGLKLSHVLSSEAVMAAVGEDDIPMPDEVQFMTVENAEKMQALFADQGFIDLLPLRSEATQRVTFFLGEKMF